MCFAFILPLLCKATVTIASWRGKQRLYAEALTITGTLKRNFAIKQSSKSGQLWPESHTRCFNNSEKKTYLGLLQWGNDEF